MVTAVIGSSLWLTFATRIGAPVSTTHSIVGAIIGSGLACFGTDSILWGWSGVAQIAVSWFVAPVLAGVFASILFLFTKICVLEREEKRLRNAFYVLPVYYCFTASVLCLVIIWNGGTETGNPSTLVIICAVIATAVVTLIVYLLFFLPFYRRRVIDEDWTLRWYHVFMGVLLYKRGIVPPRPDGVDVVNDYYTHSTAVHSTDEERDRYTKRSADLPVNTTTATHDTALDRLFCRLERFIDDGADMKWYNIHGCTTRLWRAFTHGIRQDVLSSSSSFLAGDVQRRNLHAQHYDNKVEHLYSFLQALTAATTSFAHGANDVSNAVGPLSTIFVIWKTNTLGTHTSVPLWILLYGSLAIVLGLWTYGYHVMRNLGNRLTLHSPSRGFAMELGAALTTILATRLALPVSTTQSIVGATVFVGLCSGDVKAVNYRMVGWCYLGWMLTVPCAGLISGGLCAFIINAPHYMREY